MSDKTRRRRSFLRQKCPASNASSVHCPPCGGHTGSWTVQALTPHPSDCTSPGRDTQTREEEVVLEGGGGGGGGGGGREGETRAHCSAAGGGGEVQDGGVRGQRQTRDTASETTLSLDSLLSSSSFFSSISPGRPLQPRPRSPV